MLGIMAALMTVSLTLFSWFKDYRVELKIKSLMIILPIALAILVSFITIYATQISRMLERQRARYLIEKRLKKRKGKRASFEAIRAEVNKTYTDDFLRKLIDNNPEIFRTVTMKKGHKPGITLIGEESEDTQQTT